MVDTSGLPLARPGKREKKPKQGLKRKKRLDSKSTLQRGGPLPKVNKKREKERRGEDGTVYGPQHRACAELPCYVCGREGMSWGHHEPPVSRGGKDEDTLPMCDILKLGVNGCHQHRHNLNARRFWSLHPHLNYEDAKESVRAYMAAKARGGAVNRTEHLLTIIAEECAEIAQRATKALRFGLEEVQPGQTLTNAQRIREEVADLIAALQMVEEGDGVSLLPTFADDAVRTKREKVERFLIYSTQCGTLS